MKNDDILSSIEEIVRRILENETIKLTNQITINQVPGWDSLNHIRIIIAIENKFKMKYTAEEIRTIQDIGKLCDIVHGKVG